MNKKLMKSPITIACYVIAALSLVYGIYAFAGGVSYIKQYFAAYGMSIADNMKEAATYLLTQSFTPFCFAVLLFMCGHINNGVRALNPDNYVPSSAPTSAPAEGKTVEVETAEAESTEITAEADEIAAETAESAKINADCSEDAAAAAVDDEEVVEE